MSDTDLDEKTPSPDKPAGKRMDIKATPEQKSPEIRRSSRHRKNALATKLGNAIPIAKISEAPESCLVAHVELTTTDVSVPDQPAVNPQGNQNPLPEIIPSLSSSEEIMCTEIHMETATPENTRHPGTFSKNPKQQKNRSARTSRRRWTYCTLFHRFGESLWHSNEKEKTPRNKSTHIPRYKRRRTHNKRISKRSLKRRGRISEVST